MSQLQNYIEKYGSDKHLSGYSFLYERAFDVLKDKPMNVLEIGIGTLLPGIPSTFIGNPSHYPHYLPGGSLRAWRDYFKNSHIYGVDIAEDCKFEEDRIKTFLFSSLENDKCEEFLGVLTFDIIIDDGLHTGVAQMNTMKNLFHRVNTDGYYVIEDCGGGGDGTHIFRDFEKEFKEIADFHEYYFGGNIIFIKKNYSGKGRINDFNSFIINDETSAGPTEIIQHPISLTNENIFEKIKNFKNHRIEYTIINDEQIDYLVTYLMNSIDKNVDGDVVEFGCYVGESSKYMMKTLIETQSNKKLYVYDSFEGLPPKSVWEENTGWTPGTLNTTEDILIQNFLNNKLPPPIVHKDWFKNVPLDKIPEKISFAFLDGDFYDSIYDSLSKIYDRVSDGGYICFHDYLRNDLPGVEAAIKRFFTERNIPYTIISRCDQLGIIKKNGNVEVLDIPNSSKKENVMNCNKDLTVVTGLWNIGRIGRDFTHYIDHFKRFLEIPVNMFIYIPQEYEYLVWEVRSKENTYVKITDLEYIKRLYDPFWNKTQSIRTNPDWYNSTGETGWLSGSPQATLEWYNPIVQSKMFLLNDATIWNPFNNEYFVWLDAGITNTVHETFFIENRSLDKLLPYLDSFLFLSYPYETNTEIHGFNFKKMNQYAREPVKYVCRGGLFGGKKDVIHQANATYYSTLSQTLNEGNMGTEECIFSIMAYREPNIYRRYMLDGNGLIVKFIQALIDDKVTLEPVTMSRHQLSISNYDLSKVKTNVYMLTFNFPEQVQNTVNSMQKVPEWLTKPHLVLIDNSTDENAVNGNKVLAEKYNFEYVKMDSNTGICGGRQKAAEHFHESDADFMFFFEDDMTVNPPELKGEFCRNGFRKYIPNLYNILHKIMLKEKFDFLKMSFTEVYFDNDKALPWYNVPQHIRTRDWPEYDKLPITGLDPNSPQTKYTHINSCDGVAYIVGEVNYCNWPMIVSKEGNKKMFIDTKWAHPFEQTWSSHIYQITKEGKIHSAILLASPIWHERIKWYKPEERREN